MIKYKLGGPHTYQKKKYSTRDKPTVVTLSQSSSSDSPNVPMRPRQSEIFCSHFANAFTSTPDGNKESSPSPILEEGPSDMEAFTSFVVSLIKPRKTGPSNSTMKAITSKLSFKFTRNSMSKKSNLLRGNCNRIR